MKDYLGLVIGVFVGSIISNLVIDYLHFKEISSLEAKLEAKTKIHCTEKQND